MTRAHRSSPFAYYNLIVINIIMYRKIKRIDFEKKKRTVLFLNNI